MRESQAAHREQREHRQVGREGQTGHGDGERRWSAEGCRKGSRGEAKKLESSQTTEGFEC